MAAVAFWLLEGHSLQLELLENDASKTYDLSIVTRILLTVLTGFLAGGFLTWLVYAFRHDYCTPRRPHE